MNNRTLHSCVVALLSFLLLPSSLFAQGTITFQYFYDDLGQLTKVIDSSGNEIDYFYDAVGNILQITRGTAPGGLAISSFTPQQGPVGINVTIQGQGFSANLSSNTVQFNGTPATVTSASTTTLVATVPTGATTGPISVTVGGSKATSSSNFIVLQVPVITSVSPNQVNFNTNVPNFQVTGSNLTGATFSFVPVFSPPAVTVTSTSINGAGTAATLGLTIGGGPAGTYVLVGTNTNGSSSSTPSSANSLQVLNPNQDVTPPTVSITSPSPGAQLIQGTKITVTVNATDNVGVTEVGLTANGTGVGTLTTAPYNFNYLVPTVNAITFQATARDAAQNLGTSSPVAVTVIPDPLTTVTGTVVDSKQNPVSGATVTTLGGLFSTTGTDGTFSIPGVSTIQGNVYVTASYTASDGTVLTGTSLTVAPVRGGTTNVGTFVVEPPETKVLVATGVANSNGPYTNTAEVFDPGTGTWTQVQNQIPNSPPANDGGFCASNMALLSNGEALFAGGGCSDDGTTTNAASLYDPIANQWTSAAPMNYGRDQFGMVTLTTGNTMAFAGCAGGCSGPNILGQYIGQVGPSAEIYDASSNAWTTVASLNTGRGNFGMGNFLQSVARLIDGRILACNGTDGFSTSYNTCEIYDPMANQWSTTAPIGDTGPHQFIVPLSGAVLAVENDGLTTLLFDPVSSAWLHTGSLSSAQLHGVLTLLSDGRVLLSGGTNSSVSVRNAQIYDPATGTWAATGQMNVARSGHIGVLLNDGRVLVAGGQDNTGNILSSAEIYDPSSGTWSPTGSMSQGRYYANAVGLPPTSAGTGTVSGQVTNVDGSAAVNILVTILSIDASGVSARSARTDTVGNYVFGGVPIKQPFTVRAYTSDQSSFVDSASTTISTNGQKVTVNLTLPALATVQVTVLQVGGSPFVGAQVDIQTSSNQFFRPVGTTDANGFLSISNVAQGNFTVEALVPPALTLIGTATGIVTTQGQVIPVTISDPGTTVTGTVVDTNNNPVGAAMVTTNGGLMGTTLNDGTFSISSVPTAFGNIIATATATVGGVFLSGTSVPVPAVGGGVTNVGTIVLYSLTGWAEFRFDPPHTGFNPGEVILSPATVGNLVLDWTYVTSYPFYSSPAVANGVVYVGSYGYYYNNSFHALNASTGALLWEYSMGPVFSSPAVANGAVYVTSDDGNLYALNASTGALLWRYTNNYYYLGAPTVANGVVYVASYYNGVSALNAATGALLWQYPTPYSYYSSPAVANGVVYFSSYYNLDALNAVTGALLWQSPITYSDYSSPAVANGVVYIGSDDGNLYAFNAATGALVWKNLTGCNYCPVYSSPAVANGVVYVGSYGGGGLYALSADTGSLLWSYPTGFTFSSPAVFNGVVYVGSENGNLWAFQLRSH